MVTWPVSMVVATSMAKSKKSGVVCPFTVNCVESSKTASVGLVSNGLLKKIAPDFSNRLTFESFTNSNPVVVSSPVRTFVEPSVGDKLVEVVVVGIICFSSVLVVVDKVGVGAELFEKVAIEFVVKVDMVDVIVSFAGKTSKVCAVLTSENVFSGILLFCDVVGGIVTSDVLLDVILEVVCVVAVLVVLVVVVLLVVLVRVVDFGVLDIVFDLVATEIIVSIGLFFLVVSRLS